MANTRISNLTASASNLASTDLAPVVQTAGVGPVKMTGLQLAGGLLGSTTFNGSTVTTSQPVLNLSQTWNAGAVTFTGLKFNATDTASAAASLLLDLQVGAASKFKVDKTGNIYVNEGNKIYIGGSGGNNAAFYANGGNDFRWIQNGVQNAALVGGSFRTNSASGFQWSGTANGYDAADLILSRAGTATLQLGAADAASPVAQTLQVQGVVAGTSNTAGANFTIRGSDSTGNAAGGSIIFQVAPAGSSGTSQNAYATALTIASTGAATFSSTVTSGGNFLMPVGAAIGNGANLLAVGAGNIYPANSPLSLGTFTVPFSFLSVGTASNAALLNADAANTLALRNGTNAQTFNLYETYTDSSNYSRVSLTQSSVYFFLQTQAAGTGTKRGLILRGNGTNSASLALVGDALSFGTSAADYWTMSSSGHFLAGADNTYDIGATSSGRPRNIYTAGTLYAGSSSTYGLDATIRNATVTNFLYVGGVAGNPKAALYATTTNKLMLYAAASDGTPITLLSFGSLSASNVALKPSTTTLQVRLADDSAFAPIQGKLTTDTARTAGDPTTDGYLVLYDSTGTAYKVPCVAV